MMTFGPEVLSDPRRATSREWLETNGIGGFASSTLIGMNSRRYHGLLVAATRPPAGRLVLLSKLEETLEVDGRRYDLGTNQYSGTLHPQGFQHQQAFALDPFPVMTFVVDGLRLEKTIFMVYGENTTVVQYRLLDATSRRVTVELRPLVAFRDYHATTHENGALDPNVSIHSDTLLSLRPYADLPQLYIAHNGQSVDPAGYWYRNFEYPVEKERGLDFVEDLFNPLVLRFELSEGSSASVIASLEARQVSDADELRQTEIRRREMVAMGVSSAQSSDLVRLLTAAADQYVVSRGSQKTIVAGYPWFTDWGRDTMIALPGLTLTTGRHDVARSILQEFARHVDRGMLPNRFPDGGELPEYNTIDATLWYFEAVRAYLQSTNDLAFVRKELCSVLRDIVDWHVRGTRYGIRMDDDGLIVSTDVSVQLTWMDAKIGDWVVTPRNGKAVEIQALWYNALRTMEDLSRAVGDSAFRSYRQLASRAEKSFNAKFWNEQGGYLYDTVSAGFPEDGARDATMRPNQILAVSLTHSMLPRNRSRQVVAAVQRDLFTPYGLRSLAPSDPMYRGRYDGGPAERDSSYHQGPVWPWLMGPFIDAYLKVHGRRRQDLNQVNQWLESFSTHIGKAGLGHISEIFDGDAPHHARGCFAQAWSVAEVLRVAANVQPSTRKKAARTTG